MLAFKPAPASALTSADAPSGNGPGAPAKVHLRRSYNFSTSIKFAVDRAVADYNM